MTTGSPEQENVDPGPLETCKVSYRVATQLYKSLERLFVSKTRLINNFGTKQNIFCQI